MILKDAPEGFQATEIGLIPVDWKLKQAKDISGCIVPGRNKPKKFDGIIPWVTTSDIDELGKIDNSKISLFISKEEANAIGSRVVPDNAVIMSCVGELGVVCVAENEIVINQQLHAFLPSSKINSKYLSYILSSLREYFYSKATKTTLPYLNKDNCNSTPIPLPCIEEQTAIANALSDVDALLTELENLITKKQAIKTATMQQLLTGKTRLPQFATYSEGAVEGKRKGTKPSELGEIPEDWDISTLGGAATFINGRAYALHEWETSGTPVIRLQNLTGRGADYYYSNLKLPEKQYCDNGDLLFMWSATFGPVIWKGDKAIYHYHIWKIENKEISDSKFLYFVLLDMTEKLKNSSSSGGTMLHITKGMMESTPCILPPKEEQTAIATILSDMDNEIQTLEERLEKTRQIKQGMMQQILTGRTRLPY